MRHLLISKVDLDNMREVIRRDLLRFLIVHEYWHEHYKYVDDTQHTYIEFGMSEHDVMKLGKSFGKVASAIYSCEEVEFKDRPKRIRLSTDKILYDAGVFHIVNLLTQYNAEEALDILRNPLRIIEVSKNVQMV